MKDHFHLLDSSSQPSFSVFEHSHFTYHSFPSCFPQSWSLFGVIKSLLIVLHRDQSWPPNYGIFAYASLLDHLTLTSYCHSMFSLLLVTPIFTKHLSPWWFSLFQLFQIVISLLTSLFVIHNLTKAAIRYCLSLVTLLYTCYQILFNPSLVL